MGDAADVSVAEEATDLEMIEVLLQVLRDRELLMASLVIRPTREVEDAIFRQKRGGSSPQRCAY